MSLRSLFLIAALIALVCAAIVSVQRSWFGPAREAVEAQQQFDQIIATNNWKGQINPLHYFGEVRILIHQVPESELEAIFPLLHKISWLKVIRVYEPHLSEEALRRWREEFPSCTLLVHSDN